MAHLRSDSNTWSQLPLLACRIILIAVGAGIVLISLTPYVSINDLYFPFLGLFSLGGGLLALADKLVTPVYGLNLNTTGREEFWFFSTTVLAVAVALSLIYCFWNRPVSHKRLTFMYSTFLVILLSMSSVNLAFGDSLLNRGAQVLIDLMLLVLGSIVILMLFRLGPKSMKGAVLRAVIVFLVFLQGVALPGLFGLFLLLAGDAMSLAQTQSFNPAWISSAAAVASAVVAVITYRASKRTVFELGRRKQVVLSV